MATINSVASGNWSDFNTVFGGTEPGPDDVVLINDHIINVDQNIDVISISTSVTSAKLLITNTEVIGNGGSITIDADILEAMPNNATGHFVNISSTTGTITFIGLVSPANSSSCRREVIFLTGSSTINVDIICGGVNGGGFGTFLYLGPNYVGVRVTATFTGVLNVNETRSYASTNTIASPGVYVEGACIVNVVDVRAGGSFGSGDTVWNTGFALFCAGESSIINVVNCYPPTSGAGTAINGHKGILRIENCYGSAGAGSNGVVHLTDLCDLEIVNAIGTGTGYAVRPWTTHPDKCRVLNASGSRCILGAANRLARVDNIDATVGFPIDGPFRLYNAMTPVKVLDENGDDLILGNPLLLGDQPDTADTRDGTIYAGGNLVGTCKLPPKETTSFGVPVDHEVGEALLTHADIRNALGLSAANLGQKLDAIAAPSPDAKPVTFTATTDLPEEGIPVTGTIIRVAGREFVTGIGGQVTALLDPSETPYTAQVFANQIYEDVADIEITVGEDPVAVSIAHTMRPELAPNPDQLIEVQLTASDQFAVPLAGAVVTATVIGFPVFTGGSLVVNAPRQKPLNPLGPTTLMLYRGLTYRFVIRVKQDVVVDIIRTLPVVGDSFAIDTLAE